MKSAEVTKESGEEEEGESRDYLVSDSAAATASGVDASSVGSDNISHCASQELIGTPPPPQPAGCDSQERRSQKEEEEEEEERDDYGGDDLGLCDATSKTPHPLKIAPHPPYDGSEINSDNDDDDTSTLQSTILSDPETEDWITAAVAPKKGFSKNVSPSNIGRANQPGAVSVSATNSIPGGGVAAGLLKSPVPTKASLHDNSSSHHDKKTSPQPPSPSSYDTTSVVVNTTPAGCVTEERMLKEAGKTASKEVNPSYISYLDDDDDDEHQQDQQQHPVLNDIQTFPTTNHNNRSGEMSGESSTIGACHVAGPGVPVSQTSFIIGGGNDDDDNAELGLGLGLGLGRAQRSSKSSLQFRQRSSMLVEAMPVLSTMKINAAQPIDEEILEARETRDKQYKRLACCLVTVACLVLTLSLVFVLKANKHNNSNNNKGESTSTNAPTPNPSSSSNTLPPGMEDLEMLYFDLPEKTRDYLFLGVRTPQNEAWEWLLEHPNLSDMEEWKKKQIFALATFFYSIGGPNWPESISSRWLDVNTSECSWVLRDEDISYWSKVSGKYLGPNAYEWEDFYPCNTRGEIQSIVLKGVRFGNIPQEIELLTSLRILVISFGQMSGKLSDMLIPELMQLPGLELLSLADNRLSGTIPNEIHQMTTLRHLILGGNELAGSLPLSLFNIDSLESFILDGTDVGGTLPTEFGLMTRLTNLELARSSFNGPIPSELGLLTRLEDFRILENMITSSIPSELGLMTNMKNLLLRDNSLTGLIPSQLGLMTNAIDFVLGNDLILHGSNNNFSCPFPVELWELSHMEQLSLSNLPYLSGRVPSQIMMPNLTILCLDGSPRLSGTIPDQACVFVDKLDFDCSDSLCGCDCDCTVTVSHNNNTGGSGESTAELSNYHFQNDQDYPGLFPFPINRSNAITINLRTDLHPEETRYEWSSRNASSGLWSILDLGHPQEPEKVHTYTKEVQSNSVYRLEIFVDDSRGSDGACCSTNDGFGWFTITNSTPSPYHKEGTVIWEAAAGSVLVDGGSFHVYLWVDSDGRAKLLEHLTGPRT